MPTGLVDGVTLVLSYTATSVVVTAVADMSDGNGNMIPDWWENLYFGGTNTAAGAPSADPDHDGMSNLQEFRARTDPGNTASVFAISKVDKKTGTKLTFEWPSKSGRKYTIKRNDNLVSGVWVTVESNIAAVPPSNVYTDAPPAASVMFYRIVVE